jgi:xanthine dehydrogenase YagS FAD-binding subunit
MRSFEHVTAETVANVCILLESYKPRARLYAGGTDLLSLLKHDVLPQYPDLLIDIKTIPGLDRISQADGCFSIGALTTLAYLSRSPFLKTNYPVLVQAAFSVASPQIRNVATLGGNLCQEVRCWYYRFPGRIGGPIQCLRKGSGTCLAIRGDNRFHAILGAKKCMAVCPSDTAVALTALDAHLVIEGVRGVRTLPVQEFYHSLGNNLAGGEMIREIKIPEREAPGQQRFLKFSFRKPIDFAVVSVAVVLTMHKNICTDARIVLGAVGPSPYRATVAEETLIGQPISQETAEAAAEAGLIGAKGLSKNSYKIQIAKTLIKRAILGLSE